MQAMEKCCEIQNLHEKNTTYRIINKRVKKKTQLNGVHGKWPIQFKE